MDKQRVLGNAVALSHRFVERVLNNGDIAIDATAGNGNDTVFLAKLVGSAGKVYAFDVQEAALTKTRVRLDEAELQHHVQLINDGHENINQYVQEQISAVMFNLGYLPGGDQALITRPETTCQAVTSCLHLLRPRGVISIVVYPGHQGGEIEADRLEALLSGLDQKKFSVLRMDFINRKNNSPYLVLIEKENCM